MRKSGWCLAISVLALSIGACSGGAASSDDTDALRGSALEMPIGQVINDDLAPDKGDVIDWKSISVPAPGFLTVSVFWDHSKDIDKAVITVHDKFGTQLAERKHDPNVPNDEVNVRVDQGYYFVKLEAQSGYSIYSIQIFHSVGGDGPGDDGGGGVPRPEFGLELTPQDEALSLVDIATRLQ